MGSLIFRALLGAVAGLFTWAICEPSAPNLAELEKWERWEYGLFATLGALVGLAVGGLGGYLQGGRVHTIRGATLGALFGSLGILAAYGLASALTKQLFGDEPFNPATTSPVLLILARTLAITMIGAGLGLATGFSSLNWRRGLQGLVGGALGGAVGGAAFDVVGSIVAPLVLLAKGTQLAAGEMVTAEVGSLPRALSMVILGASIALFVGIVEQVSRSAWLRQSLGRNEGREWSLYSAQTVIGRGESAQVPIFGDSAVAPIHAVITHTADGYVLSDAQSGHPTYLNGVPVASALLVHGAQIQVGATLLHFQIRGGPAIAPARDPQPQASSPQIAQAPISSVPVLFALDGPLVGQRFPVGSGIEIGREASGISLGFDSSASRRHASVALASNGITLTDLGSTNGTFLNGQRIAAANAQRGDLVRIGVTTFRVE